MKLFPPNPYQYMENREHARAWDNAHESYRKNNTLKTIELKRNYAFFSAAVFTFLAVTYHFNFTELIGVVYLGSILGIAYSFALNGHYERESAAYLRLKYSLQDEGYIVEFDEHRKPLAAPLTMSVKDNEEM